MPKKKQCKTKDTVPANWDNADVVMAPADWTVPTPATSITVTVPDVVARMTYKQFKASIKALKAYYKELRKVDDAIRALGGSSYSENGQIGTFGSRLTEEYVAVLASAVGDKDGIVAWWCWDTDLGKENALYYIGTDKREVKGVKALYALILELDK